MITTHQRDFRDHNGEKAKSMKPPHNPQEKIFSSLTNYNSNFINWGIPGIA